MEIFGETNKKQHYKRVNVETAQSENGKTIVETGLVGGERVIVEGGFYLLDAK